MRNASFYLLKDKPNPRKKSLPRNCPSKARPSKAWPRKARPIYKNQDTILAVVTCNQLNCDPIPKEFWTEIGRSKVTTECDHNSQPNLNSTYPAFK